MTESPARTLQLLPPGLIPQFLMGGLISQLVYQLAIGLPAILVLVVAQSAGWNSAFAAGMSSALGVGICAVAGSALGSKLEVRWPFLAAAAITPAAMLLVILGKPIRFDLFAYVTIVGYVVGGVVFVVGTWLGRRRIELRSPTEQTLPADGVR